MTPGWREGSVRRENRQNQHLRASLMGHGEMSHFLASMQNMPSAVCGRLWGQRPWSSMPLPLGMPRPSLTDLCTGKRPQIMQSRALSPCQDHKDKDGQTKQTVLLLGKRGRKEARQKGIQKDQVKGREASLCSPSAGDILSSKVQTS